MIFLKSELVYFVGLLNTCMCERAMWLLTQMNLVEMCLSILHTKKFFFKRQFLPLFLHNLPNENVFIILCRYKVFSHIGSDNKT